MLTKEDLSRIYWLAGSTCAGKSTISEEIAKKLQWNVYHVDDYFIAHREKSNPQKHPVFHKISHLTGDDLWLRPVEEQIATEHPFLSDEFELMKDDLKEELEKDQRNIICDAFAPPQLLSALLPDKHHVYYLIATEDFQRHHYSQRTFIHDVLAKTSNKDLAWKNWMQRDVSSARKLEQLVEKYEMPHLLVDGTLSIEDTAAKIMRHWTQNL
jgi:adenylate kinase family enzyme